MMIKNRFKSLLSPDITRRGFIKSSSMLGGLAAVTSTLPLPFKSTLAQATEITRHSAANLGINYLIESTE